MCTATSICLTDFNPRSRVGNDFYRTSNPLCYSKFQSTFPRGERRNGSSLALPALDFNPRSRVGNDRFLEKGSEIVYNFNPRSRVGNDAVVF